MMKQTGGVVLGLMLVLSVLFSGAGYAVIAMGVSRVDTAEWTKNRARARYAAEAGLVWGMQRLWADPDYCGVVDPPVLGGLTVDVSVTNCVTKIGQQISAAVTY